MKIRFLKLKHWLVVTVMGLLGLSSCVGDKQEAMYGGPEPDYDDTIEMYGPPETFFRNNQP